MLTTVIIPELQPTQHWQGDYGGLQAASAQATAGSKLWSSRSCRVAMRSQREEGAVQSIYGPRALVKHKHPDDWPSGIIPPPLLVSRASMSCTTSSMSGRLSGFPSQHLRIMFANALGQQRGMSGRKFCPQNE